MTIIKSNHAGLGGAGAPGGALASFYSHTIDQSLRFNGGAYLTFTPSSAGSQTTWTWSAWVKRGAIGVKQNIFNPARGGDGTNEAQMSFQASDAFQIYDSGALRGNKVTTRLFRDPSAWYHIVVVLKTADSTAEDRVQIYVNGTRETSFSTNSNPSQSTTWGWNAAQEHSIGSYNYSTDQTFFDGYLAEVHFIDGQAYDASYFGETKDGVWIPKAYSGSYGTNGWYLPFDDSSAIGDDESGNTNDWTANNLAAHDVVPDSPTNNFATMNPLMIGDARVHSSAVYSEGNLKVACGGFSTSTIGGGYSTIAIPKDKKIYCEVVEPNKTGDYWGAGVIIDNHVQASNQLGGDGSIVYYNRSVMINGTENDYGSSAGIGGLGVSKFAAGDVLGIAVDGTTGKVWFHRNGTYFGEPQGHQSGAGTTGNPSAGTNEIGTINNTASINPSGEIFIFLTGNGSVDDLYVNFGQDSTFNGNKSAGSETDANGEGLFQYAVPTDYVCLHSGNMSDPTIGPRQSEQADDNFDTKLYTGTGSTLNITGVNFQPDWVWVKRRSGIQEGSMTDSVRGVNAQLRPAVTNAESTFSNAVTSFNSDGFTLGADTGPGTQSYNYYTDNHVAWLWKAGGAPTADNSAGNGATPTAGSVKIDGSNLGSALAGSLAATRLSANTTAGFSIIIWDASGISSGTMAHGLTAAPDIIIAKNRNHGTNWFVQVPNILADTHVLNLDTTGAAYNPGINHFDDTVPTATVFSFGGYLGGHSDVGSNTQMIAYCFHSVDGYSKIGSYTGNGDADGTFVFTGFRPAWAMVRRSSSTGGWHIFDRLRPNAFNVINQRLEADNADAENSTSGCEIDFLSNGFKFRGNFDNINGSGATHIYLAFAEAPFKFANAR